MLYVYLLLIKRSEAHYGVDLAPARETGLSD
jgi:hypothetical protein